MAHECWEAPGPEQGHGAWEPARVRGCSRHSAPCVGRQRAATQEWWWPAGRPARAWCKGDEKFGFCSLRIPYRSYHSLFCKGHLGLLSQGREAAPTPPPQPPETTRCWFTSVSPVPSPEPGTQQVARKCLLADRMDAWTDKTTVLGFLCLSDFLLSQFSLCGQPRSWFHSLCARNRKPLPRQRVGERLWQGEGGSRSEPRCQLLFLPWALSKAEPVPRGPGRPQRCPLPGARGSGPA